MIFVFFDYGVDKEAHPVRLSIRGYMGLYTCYSRLESDRLVAKGFL